MSARRQRRLSTLGYEDLETPAVAPPRNRHADVVRLPWDALHLKELNSPKQKKKLSYKQRAQRAEEAMRREYDSVDLTQLEHA